MVIPEQMSLEASCCLQRSPLTTQLRSSVPARLQNLTGKNPRFLKEDMQVVDSPEKWICVMFYFQSEDELQSVLLGFTKCLDLLRLGGLMEHWHFRYGTKPSDLPFGISIRIRPRPAKQEEVQEQVAAAAEELKAKNIIIEYSFDPLKQYFLSGPRKFDDHEWKNWNSTITTLWHLSEIILIMFQKQEQEERKAFFFEEVLHHLFNMIGAQDLFNEFIVKRGKEFEIAESLEPESTEELKKNVTMLGLKGNWLTKSPLKLTGFFGEIP